MATKAKAKKGNSKLNLRDWERSRRNWQPDWDELEKELQRSNERLRKKHGKPPINE